MSYGEYLRELLRPLGVYALQEDSLSGGAVAALGAALDDAEAAIDRQSRESVTMTATEAGLAQMEALFPYMATEQTAEARRQAISGFLQVSGDSFTPAAIHDSLIACGTACQVTPEAGGVLAVSFPGLRGRPENWPEKRRIIESILPCHLAPRYDFLWNTWGRMRRLGVTWGDLRGMTVHDWSTDVELP